ncbi:MAG TPA: 1,2-phenylacetyl-CoA epoxidase subunit PaaC [Chitinophagales bacterium]|nr:1,2-phenylacetyl-CoA epoxidase subunit PaaC [Chitinophagales bacterium]
MNTDAVKEMLYKMADDALIIGHRNSEWTGIGPMLEEDLAFSSMAQDKIGHAQALYKLLHEILGEEEPDKIAFMREEGTFKCCQLVELPIGEYDFSLVRQFLFDHAEALRYEMLTVSSFTPLAQLAKKVKGEIKYHVMHADTFLKQLAQGNDESKARMQAAVNYAFPYALGIFELGPYEAQLAAEGIFAGEEYLKAKWLEKVTAIIEGAGLKVPVVAADKIVLGGRKGFHSEYLKPLLDEMCEVVRTDPEAEW